MSRRLKQAGRKSWHPRHATQSAEAADRKERAIEKTERQAARKEIRNEEVEVSPDPAQEPE